MRAARAKEQVKLVAGITEYDAEHFRRDLRNGADSYFSGLQQKDASLFGGAVRDVGRAFEDLVDGILLKHGEKKQGERLEEKINALKALVGRRSTVDGDDTGDVLESLLRRNSNDEDLASFSQSIKEAMLGVAGDRPGSAAWTFGPGSFRRSISSLKIPTSRRKAF